MTPSEEKDRLGEKLRDAEKAREDKFFAERDRVLMEKLRAAKSGEQEQAARELARSRCPRCGIRLVAKTHLEVPFDECPSCGGLWFDKGEVDRLARRDKHGWLARYLGFAD